MKFAVRYKKNGEEKRIVIEAKSATGARRQFFRKVRGKNKYTTYSIVSIYLAWGFSRVLYGPEWLRQVRR